MMAQTKEQKAASGRKHYGKNSDAVKAPARAYTDANRERLRNHVRAHKEVHPCVDCGNDNWIVLQFDHVRGKKLFNVADGIRRSLGLKTLEAEIKKCEVVCANCHAIRTYSRK
jgi:hypothetical protein